MLLPAGTPLIAASVLAPCFAGLAGALLFRSGVGRLVRFCFRSDAPGGLAAIRKLSRPYYAVVVLASLELPRWFWPGPMPGPLADLLHWAGILLPAALAVLAIELTRVVLVDRLLVTQRGVRVPGLMRDMAFGAVYLVLALIFLGSTFHLDLAPFFTGSAVITIVVGLALQDTLGNLLSGLAIHLDPPFRLGDWVSVDGKVGRVEQITWRATRLATKHDEQVIIPNNTISKGAIVNFHSTTRHAHSVNLGLPYALPPGIALRALLEVATGTPGVLETPVPEVHLDDFGESAILYRVKVWIHDYDDAATILTGLRQRLWYRLQREGWEIPFPARQVLWGPAASPSRDEEVLAALRGVDFLAPLESAQLAELAAACQRQRYTAGEQICRRGDPGNSCFVILSGSVEVRLADDFTGPLAMLVPPQLFGEMSLLTGEPRTATAIACAECELLTISHAQFGRILRENPVVSELICRTVAERRAHSETVIRDHAERMARIPAPAEDAQIEAFSRDLLRKLTSFFGLV